MGFHVASVHCIPVLSPTSLFLFLRLRAVLSNLVRIPIVLILAVGLGRLLFELARL